MTFEAPSLDDRTFDDLVSELLELIPSYMPEWTDWNDSDPGITLIQLWAHLVEVMLNRLDRLPERAYATFLELVGVTQRPGAPAQADVTFAVRPGLPQATLPDRARLSADPGDGDPPLVFETSKAVDPVMAELAVLQLLSGDPAIDLSLHNNPDGAALEPLGSMPQVGDALYFGFAVPPGYDLNDPFDFPARISIRFFELEGPLADVSVRAPSDDAGRPAELQWEYRAAESDPLWHALRLLEDETVAMTRGGYMEIEGPRGVRPITNVGPVEDGHFWIRCRLESGRYPDSSPPRYDFLRLNTVPAEQLETITGEIVAVADGRTDLTIQLSQAPVDGQSLVAQVETPGGSVESWERRTSLYSSSRIDRHYVLDSAGGRMTFGDGRHGAVPVAGSTITALAYRAGGGERGNVLAETITIIADQVAGIDSVTNPRRAFGGSDVEDVAALKQRAPDEIRGGGAVVTAADFVSLAEGVGGVARAKVWPNARPSMPGVEVPGSITVVIVPEPAGPAPQPSPDLISVVDERLEERRLITTEVHVSGPEYRRISVDARVQAEAGHSFTVVEEQVRTALDEYLAPVRASDDVPGRFSGWEFGEDLIATSLFGVIEGVSGVASVPILDVIVNGLPHRDLRQPVVLNPMELFSTDEHRIVVVPRDDREYRDAV